MFFDVLAFFVYLVCFLHHLTTSCKWSEVKWNVYGSEVDWGEQWQQTACLAFQFLNNVWSAIKPTHDGAVVHCWLNYHSTFREFKFQCIFLLIFSCILIFVYIFGACLTCTHLLNYKKYSKEGKILDIQAKHKTLLNLSLLEPMYVPTFF